MGNYELLEEIARGGMGVVYRARQLSLNRMVALKVLLNGPFSSRDFVKRFRKEAEIVARLRHPHIVTIHEIGEHDGHHFISLEFVAGQNFSELARDRPLSAQRAAAYLKTIAEAVEYAHQKGVLHRDLKPSNILLDTFDQPRVTDFGLAKLINQDAQITVTGQVLGTPNYMSPEQASGMSPGGTVASDVYSLGAILYELLTGRPPFQAETIPAVLLQVGSAEPVAPRRLNPDTPADVQTICLKCLQKDPARRYGSAQELADDLGRFVAGQPIQARPVSRLEQAWLWCRRYPMLAATSSLLVLAIVLGLSGIFWQWRAAEAHAQGEQRQRLIAEKNASETRLNLYAADVAMASKVIQEGDYGRARRTLEQLRPKPGETDLRGFEWFYLWNLCRGDEIATLSGHSGTVMCVAYSPDGRVLASGSQDGTVRIWSASERKLIKKLTLTHLPVWSIAFTPDGHYLVTGCNRGVQLWSTRTWQVEKNFPGHMAALSKSGTFLATADSSPFFWETAGPVRLYHWDTGQLLWQFDSPGRALAFSADGRLLAVAGKSSGIQLLDATSGTMLRDWHTKHSVWSLNFSPDSRQLISSGWSTDVSIWPVDGISSPQMIPNAPLHVWSSIFSKDGRVIVTTSSDQTVRVYDAETFELKTVLHGHDSEVWCAAFSPDGQILATGGKDQAVLLWSLPPPERTKIMINDNDILPMFSPDGKYLATVDPVSQQTLLWDADKGLLLATNLAKGSGIVGFSAPGDYVAFAGEELKLKIWSRIKTMAPKELALEKPVAVGDEFPIFGLSSDRQFFFAIDSGGLICVWNAENGKLLRSIRGPSDLIHATALSPHAKQIAVSTEQDNFIRLYDCATGRERDLAGHRDFVSGMDFSPDGAMLATGSIDGTIRLWNVARGESIATLPGHMQETTDVSFSPDGRTLASLARNESIKLWHIPTLRELISISDPDAGSWVKFSPDGRRLAVVTGKNTLHFLEAPSE